MLPLAPLALLLLAAVPSECKGWAATEQEPSFGSMRGRQLLLQLDLCPAGCLDEACAEDASGAGLRCLQCQGSLAVDRLTGLCGCPPGRYVPDGSPNTCADCPRGFWCDGGILSAGRAPNATQCRPGLTTVAPRSSGPASCVNQPGFAYQVDPSGLPTAAPCPVNTYNQGLRRQRTCLPCPTGWTTNGLTGQTDVSACVVPAGSYLRFPTTVAPCPQGQWKSWVGADDRCNECGSGITTSAQGSTSAADCTRLLPGYYAAALSNGTITAAHPCPQKWWCPGGEPQRTFDPSTPVEDPTIRPCPNGLWTIETGATSAAQCLTPPGHFTASGMTAKCPAGSFRAEWAVGANAASCTPCGAGVPAKENTQIVQYSATFPYIATSIRIANSSGACYIKKGQGLYYRVKTNIWRARNCVTNSWGVGSNSSGLLVRNCQSCPLNMVTSSDKVAYPNSASRYVDNGDGSRGFTSKWACVTRPGWGFNGRWSSPCEKGSFNSGDNWADCTPCPGTGQTTAAAGAGVKVSDCGTAPGYGFQAGAIAACPIGTYNNRSIDYTKSLPCFSCPTGTTTAATGSQSPSECALCIPGYGGSSCAAQCGGAGVVGTYGSGLRALHTPCADCPTTNLTVNIAGSNQTLLAQPRARLGSNSVDDCLSQWASYGDSWHLPADPEAAYDVRSGTASLSACLALCTGNCQFVTWTPTGKCQLRLKQDSIYTGAPMIAFKSLKAGQPEQASGAYVYYQDQNALTVGSQSAPSGAGTFASYSACRIACDQDASCAGWTIEMKMLESERPRTCRLVRGVYDAAQPARSFVRADVTRLQVPVLL